jgi:hypothetical protein
MATAPAFWRVFPWNPEAPSGAAHSPSFVPPATGRGRFDLPRDLSPVLYLAESPDHAVGEALQVLRNQKVSGDALKRGKLSLSLVSVSIAGAEPSELLDLCDPAALYREGLKPDRVASRHRWVTQPIARSLWTRGFAGLRWWSSFWGDWHSVVIFAARLEDRMSFGAPSVLAPDSPAVIDAANLLDIEIL